LHYVKTVQLDYCKEPDCRFFSNEPSDVQTRAHRSAQDKVVVRKEAAVDKSVGTVERAAGVKSTPVGGMKRIVTLTLIRAPHLTERFALCDARPLRAQLPFYTDDSEVTDPGRWHFEFFNEYDGLQSAQFPNLPQNTANFKLNYGLPYNLEVDVDAPFISIFRASGTMPSAGVGDTDLGVKWKFRKATEGSKLPALAASLYLEFPNGGRPPPTRLGSDRLLAQFRARTSFTPHQAYRQYRFFVCRHTSTGVIGIQTTRGHVYTGGLSLLHDISSRLTLGGEVYGGIADNSGLGRSQLQALVGGAYTIRNGLAFAFGVWGPGRHGLRDDLR
jgi:hypothetical protein